MKDPTPYQGTHLITTAPVHIATWGTYVTTPQAATDGAQVRVRTTVMNEGSQAAGAKLTTILLDPKGQEVGRQDATRELAAGAHGDFDQNLTLNTAQLWSCEHPVLYHAVNEVRVEGKVVDSTSTPFGIRTIEFTKDKGFFLNGEHVQIKGVCDHHDLGCLGAAVYRRAEERQLQILKSFGCNALRTSHNPPDPELLDLCDKMGILVMDEAFDEWKENHKKYGYAQNFDRWSDPDLSSMINRDRNHPSIVLYSIGNEIPEGRDGNPQAGVTARRLVAICHREDPTRPVTSACPSPDNDWKSGLAQTLDVFGINYVVGYYEKNDPARPSETIPPGDHSYHGQIPMIASETSSQVDSRGEYCMKLDAQGNVEIQAKPDHQISSYDYFHSGWGTSAETDLLAVKHSPWLAGEFVWSGFDYLGEPSPFAWPSRSCYFGIVDLAGFPKDRYYLYKSAWSSDPVVHILPMSWNWPGFEGKPIEVRVFTNADSVELFLNGKSLGSQNFPADSADQTLSHDNKDKTVTLTKIPGMHLAWEVPYAPGELKAIASKGGHVVATDIVHTAGAPSQIVLKPDRARIASGGEDLSFITVTILDKDGVVCPNADDEIHFALAGKGAAIAGLSDGDSTNHESFQGTDHKVFHGLGLAVLKSQGDVTGTVKLTASAEGLTSGTTQVTVSP